MTKLILAVALLLIAPQPQQSDAPDVLSQTLKSRSDLVLVPVVVRDKKGNHIPGLTKDAFRLEENGKEQLIALFEEVQPDANARPIVPPALGRGYSNLPFDNVRELRLTILVLDLLNTTPLERSDGKDDLIKFLSKGLAPNQPVSLLCITPDGLRLLVHPFTGDAAALIQSLKKFPAGGERLMPRREAARETLLQLQQIAQSYTGIPGRKSMILAAGNIPDPEIEGRAYDNRFSAIEWFQKTWKSLIDANISVYPIQLMAWASNPASRNIRPPSAEATLREVAGATGGNLCLEANEVTKCLAEAVEDSRSYYMLGFSVRPEDRKPGWRDLRVKVAVDHANIRARNGFFYGSEQTPSPQTGHDTEINALASPLASSAVPMYVLVLPPAATPVADAAPTPPGKTTVEFLLTIPLASVKIDSSSPHPMDLVIGAIALTGDIKEAGELLHPVRGNPDPELLQKFAREGIKLQEKLELLPGSYDVRFMVHDLTTNQVGTVVFPLEVK
jgi:VWFA-related protein